MAETYQRQYQDEDEAPLAGAPGAAAARAMLAMPVDGWPGRPGREPSRTP
ncbi:hypothetical protein WMF26_38170 [Sorangium sp. So ce185]